MESNAQSAPGRVLAVGELLWDLLPTGPRLGGTTANFATGCARLGRPAGLISCLGEDAWGERAREGLEETQRDGAPLLDTSLIQSCPEAPTGVVEVTVGTDGQPAYAIAMPAAWDAIRATAEAVGAARAARAICFGTLSQRAEPSRTTIRELVASAGPACLRVLDVNVRVPFFSEEVARWSLGHVSVAKISEEELDLVARAVGVEGLRGDGLEEIEGCGRRLLDGHPRLAMLAITMGSRGSLLLTPTDANYHPGFMIQVTDTVGAGDAFTAGLVHGWLAGAPLRAVNEVGNLCGSFVASRPGATPVFSGELLRRVGEALGG